MFVLRDEVTGRDGRTWAAVGVEEQSPQVFLWVLLLWDVLLLVQCPGVPRDRAKVTAHCLSPQLCSRVCSQFSFSLTCLAWSCCQALGELSRWIPMAAHPSLW